ncbi:unnamed protein product [Amoebophrya sp. A120]|nr:unnamed protein product [Amoebophrya sp. A120]|eukprot:GSA120T00000292001.1
MNMYPKQEEICHWQSRRMGGLPPCSTDFFITYLLLYPFVSDLLLLDVSQGDAVVKETWMYQAKTAKKRKSAAHSSPIPVHQPKKML